MSHGSFQVCWCVCVCAQCFAAALHATVCASCIHVPQDASSHIPGVACRAILNPSLLKKICHGCCEHLGQGNRLGLLGALPVLLRLLHLLQGVLAGSLEHVPVLRHLGSLKGVLQALHPASDLTGQVLERVLGLADLVEVGSLVVPEHLMEGLAVAIQRDLGLHVVDVVVDLPLLGH